MYNTMRNNRLKISLVAVLAMAAACVNAQSSAVKKAADAVVSLTTFKADGSILATGSGVFVETNGTLMVPWAPFAGADHAVVVDSKGARHDIDAIIGVNEIYNVAKVRIAGKSAASVAIPSAPSTASTAWIVPNKKSNAPKKVTVKSRETFMDKYTYYVLDAEQSEMLNGLPVIDDSGKLLGLYNLSSTTCSATDPRLAQDFTINAFTQNSPAIRQCGIRVALPTDKGQARIALMLSGERGGKNYKSAVNEFISMFPTSQDGYYDKALLAVSEGNKAEAESVMQTALKQVAPKDAAHYDYARILMAMEEYDKAQKEAQEANKIAPQPLYEQLLAQITYAKGNYQEAYDKFIALTHSDIRNGELFYQAMQAKAQLGGTNEELLSLLDSAVAVCDTPYTVIAAPYFLARGQLLQGMKEYRKAVTDYYQYEVLMQGRLSAEFFYQREQCEVAGKIYQPALYDIARAAALDPKNALYWAEWASLSLRVNRLDEAIQAAEHCITLEPEASEPYLILGIAQIESGKKQEGIANIQKAKALGNPQADSFLTKYK